MVFKERKVLMENFIGSIVFILPGFLMYFWIQSFGVNPVVKHTPGEFTAVAALLWLPTSFVTLLIYNGAIFASRFIGKTEIVWSLDALKSKSNDIFFLVVFLLLSVIVSFFMSLIWVRWIYPVQMKLINKVRNKRGVASFSKNPSVWDEIFTNNDSQVVEIGKINKEGEPVIGCINKASRTFEPERYLNLDDIKFFTDLVSKHEIPVSQILYDTKAGTYIKIFDPEGIRDAQIEDMKSTSSSVQQE
ncbi:hypothetical protein HPL003_17635 [Paenibacillus terrae HPL-003]|uniref:Uncharacterized protein n=1 Tax=Paenibacillus terrae (strain HPL-003) TaxID=985665 RepID=G7W0U4_PAETH|nr:DUF6338 family protein [Paenibacillus terrae]AET60271.1 hypothetical protein HPL003_17635 [Paenibacillus terrae HPL-003]